MNGIMKVILCIIIFILLFVSVQSIRCFQVAVIGDSMVLQENFMKGVEDRLKDRMLLNKRTIDFYGYAEKNAKEIFHEIREKDFRHYKYVIVFCGVNGIKDYNKTMSYLQAIYLYLKSQKVKVVAITLTPWKSYSRYSYKGMLNTKILNRWIKHEAKGIHRYIDIYDRFEDPNNPDELDPMYTLDGLHLNKKAYEIIDRKIYSKVFKELY